MHRHTFVALCVFLSYWPPCQRGLGRMGPPSRNILGLVSDTSPSIILPDDLEEDLDDDINEEDIVMIIMIIMIVMIIIFITIMR